MSGGILEIGVKSLLAYQSAIQVTSQNLENANTEYYSRQQVNFAEAMFNNGVDISNIERLFNDVANKELLRTGSVEGEASVFYSQISDFEKVLDNDSTNINKYITDSLKSIQDLTTSVGSVQSRAAFMAKLANLADRFNDVGADINLRKTNLNQSISNTVTQVNEIIKQISSISSQMQSLKAEERGQLFDQRNKLVHDLAQYVNFKAEATDDGLLNMSMTNGVTLISGTESNKLVVLRDPEDQTKLRLAVDNGSVQSDVTIYVTQGQLGGLLSYRTEALDAAESGLNRLALAMADSFNKQNRNGVDLNGLIGVDVFSDVNSPLMMNSRVFANSNNVGSSSMAGMITDTSTLTTSDYRLTFTSATDYSLSRLSDNAVISTGSVGAFPATVAGEGFSISIASGTFVAGDKYLIRPTTRGADQMALHITDAKSLALGFPIAATYNVTNNGSGIITVSNVTDTTNSSFSVVKALTPPLKIQFLTGTSYQIMNATDDSIIEGPLSYSAAPGNEIFPTPGGYDPGYRINITSEVKAGDQFFVTYNQDTTNDNRNALKMSAMYSEKLVNGGNLTFNNAYGLISNDISLKTNSAKIDADSSLTLMKQSREKYYDYSGVSMPEEATNLAKYQQCYQASAQVIQVAKSLFETIIGIVRG